MYAQLVPLYGRHQYTFRKLGSTESARIRFHESIMSYLDTTKVKAVRMTCLDLSKAQHNLLLNPLSSTGINGGFILWLKNYLSECMQRVKLQESFTCSACVPSGIPQGSVIGPILFFRFYLLPVCLLSCSVDPTLMTSL